MECLAISVEQLVWKFLSNCKKLYRYVYEQDFHKIVYTTLICVISMCISHNSIRTYVRE